MPNHVASLGSIETPPSIADRVAFWQRVHERLAKFSNRVGAEDQGKVLAAVHGKVPMPAIDEQRALQFENARADADLWAGIRDMHAETVQGHKGLIASAERAVADGEAQAAQADAKAKASQDRVERIQSGEDVPGGLGNGHTRDMKKITGMTEAELRHCEDFAKACRIAEASSPTSWEDLMAEEVRQMMRTMKAVRRAFIRRHLRPTR